MSSVARPPHDLTVAQLFGSWLPDAFDKAVAAGAKPPDAVVSVVLDGDGGGEWTLRTAGGKLAVSEGTDAAALVTIRQSVADFRAAVWGEGEMASLLPEELDLTKAITGETKLPTAALGQVKGTLDVVVPGFAGRTWKASLTFGGAATPKATVTADMATLEQLRAGTLPPAQAFFAGKIAVTDDVPWLMQIAMNLAAGGL
jgi:putative sterol carrier protein